MIAATTICLCATGCRPDKAPSAADARITRVTIFVSGKAPSAIYRGPGYYEATAQGNRPPPQFQVDVQEEGQDVLSIAGDWTWNDGDEIELTLAIETSHGATIALAGMTNVDASINEESVDRLNLAAGKHQANIRATVVERFSMAGPPE